MAVDHHCIVDRPMNVAQRHGAGIKADDQPPAGSSGTTAAGYTNHSGWSRRPIRVSPPRCPSHEMQPT
jgi:hypothetical protein